LTPYLPDILGAFATWAPRLYSYEKNCLARLIDMDQTLRRKNAHPHPKDQEMRRNWPNTPWACATFNCGSQTVCYKHADYGNLAYGWCAISALGEFDHTKGGHLILWDLHLVIEFPPGSSILIPSSAICHSNTRIQPDERRYSFTQYSSGALFRWVDNGFKKVDEYREPMTAEEKAAVQEDLSHQLNFGLSLYSTSDELLTA
jgi:hypothetical protein